MSRRESRPCPSRLLAALVGAMLSCAHDSTAPIVAAQLVFTTQPVSTVAGASISPAIVVTAKDASGNVATSFTGDVTLAFGTNPNAGTLSGTVTAAAVDGIATFSSISLNKVGIGYTLVASSGALTPATSAAFTITAGAATQLVFSQQPATTAAGTTLSPTIVVTAQDANGNAATTFTGLVTLAFGANPGGSTLSGTVTVAAVAGVATFSNIALNKASAGYTLTASSGALTPATSAAFAITAGVATQLAFAQQPVSTAAGSTIRPAITVTAKDANANVAAYAGAVTLAFGANPGTSTLAGTVTVATVAGVAAFNDISLNKIGTGYMLIASSGALTPATSVAFSVTVGEATTLTKSGGDLQTVVGATVLATPLSVTATDAFANIAAGVPIQWGVVTGGGSMGAPTSVTNALGVATSTWSLGATFGSQTATATITGLPVSAATFTATATSLPFVSLLVGLYHTCGLTTGGVAYCWGENNAGQLGDGTTTQRSTPTPVASGPVFTSLAPGYYYTCGLTAGGVAYCWGGNDVGQLGDGTTITRGVPAPVAGGLVFTSLTRGVYHTCGLTAGGAAYCWGFNGRGELGDGTMTQRLTPTPVAGGMVFTNLSAGQDHTCGLTTGGTAYCWGDNDDGEVGDGTTTQRLTPTPVAGGLTFVGLTADIAFHTCGVTAGGSAYCWGNNFYGELGDGTTTGRLTPTPVAGGLAFTSLAASYTHTCGLVAGGAAFCWGDNEYGELGDGTLSQHLTPLVVHGGLVFSSITAGEFDTCALAAGGTAYCWGSNAFGGLGDGTIFDRNVPTAVVP